MEPLVREGFEALCAVWDADTGTTLHLFFQLYRASGDMPDISLFQGSEQGATPLWSLDPKHSEKGGYSRADYRKTAERYRDSLGARLSLVAEYFQRSELGIDNPVEFSMGAKLILDCRPEGTGLNLLLAELAVLHPARVTTLVCIDFSSSFSHKRDTALQELRARLSDVPGVAPECICFAGSAAVVVGFDEWLHRTSAVFPDVPELEHGTAAAPLLETVKSLRTRVPFNEILLLSDGAFDIPLDSLVQQLNLRVTHLT